MIIAGREGGFVDEEFMYLLLEILRDDGELLEIILEMESDE